MTPKIKILFIEYLIAFASVRVAFWIGGFDFFERGKDAGFAFVLSAIIGVAIFGVYQMVKDELS